MGDPTPIVTTVGMPVAKLAIKQINYVFNYKQNLEKFKDLHSKLKNQQKEVEERVREAENESNEEPVESVTEWLSRAKEKLNSETNAELLRGEHERRAAEKCCFGYVGWNPKYRHSLSRRAVKGAEDINQSVTDWLNRGAMPLTRPPGPPSLGSVQGKFFDGLKSRQEAVHRILDVLKKNNDVNRIGVHGMGGAGKSTIVKEIARRAEKEKIFQNVLIAEVSQSPDTKLIQECLAERIGLSLDDVHDEKERALKLTAALKKRLRGRDETKTSMESNKDEAGSKKLRGLHKTKTFTESSKDEASSKKLRGLDKTKTFTESSNDEASGKKLLRGRDQTKTSMESSKDESSGKLLIILDNLWDPLELGTLGICYQLQNDPQCKIIVTSRKENVCRQMGVKPDNMHPFGDLSDDEAKLLFEEDVGDLAKNEEYKNVMEKILLKSSRLPLSINVLAKSLMNQNLDFWKKVAQKLDNSIGGEREGVHSILKMSYDFIHSEAQKMFFLLCCIFQPGERIFFWDLLEFGIGMELFHYVTSLSEAIQEARYWIDDLRSSSLLLEVNYYNGEIKIHDEVRALGISIAESKEKGKFYVRACSSWLPEEKIKECSIISMMPSESYEYFNNLNLQELQLLCMRKATLSNLTCMCFGNIKVLDLTESNIEEFPSSIEVIRDLRTLILNKCSKLKDITQVCVLLKLQILSLSESNVESLPKEIGNLVKLKLLDLTSCKIKEISVGTLASLIQLEALLMRDSFDGWQSKETVASIYELKALPLKVLEVDIKSMKQLSPDEEYKIPTLLFFGIRIGCVLDTSSSSYNVLSSPRLFIKGANACDLFKEILMDLPTKVKNLYLENIVGLKRIVATPDEGQLETESEVGEVCCGQKDCLIKANAIPELDMSSFQDGFSVLDKFQNLQEVKLVDLTELDSYALQTQNAKKLKKITIEGCEKLKYIFSRSKPNEKEDIELSALEELMLKNLPSLEGFCNEREDATDRSPSLFTKKVKLPVLEILYLERISKLKYVWDEEFCQAACDMINFTELNICECSSLESVCTISVVKGIRNLQILNIKDCEYMRQVISTEVGRENGSTPNELIFSELSTLKLSGLSNLTCFFQGSTKIKFPSLQSIALINIKNIESFVKPHYSNNEEEADNQRPKILFSSKKLIFPSLMRLELNGIQGIEILWDKATFEELPKLETISVEEMPKLMSITSVASDIQLIGGLKHIRLSLYEAVESLISFIHIPQQFHSSGKKIVFSNLLSLRLEGINIYQRDLNVEFPTLRSLESSKIPLEASLKAEKDNIQRDRSTDEQEDRRSMIKALFDNKQVKFPSLEQLAITDIPELERLFDCSIEEDDDIAAVSNSTKSTIFPNLTFFAIGDCKSMRYLFSKKLLAGLQNLEILFVWDCDSLEELFEVEDEEEQRYTGRKIILLPNLKTLTLKGLQKLKVIPWQKLPSLQSLTIENCFRNNYRKSLLPTTASSDSVTRGGRQIPLFQHLEELNIGWCDNMETVLVGSVGGDQEESLPAVEDVSVTHHSGSQEDVSATTDQYHHVPVITFPKLQKITIWYMGRLRSFISSAGHDEVHFPSLQSVMIDRCYNMRSFSSMKAVAPKLASIEIDGSEMMEVDGGTDRLNSALLHFDPIKNLEKHWPNTLNHVELHQHQLFLIFVQDVTSNPKCNECEKKLDYADIAYCCSECRFYLCSTCAVNKVSDRLVEVPNQFKVPMNWPRSLKHELHDHELQLLIAKSNFCDKCDARIYDVFMYRCKECDFDLHPNCALGPTEKMEDDDKVTAELEVIMGSELSVPPIQTDATDSTTSKPSASKKVPFLIGGDFVESQSSQFVNVINPATQEVISHVPLATKDDLNVAILVANEAFPLWRDTSITARQQIMIKFQDLIVRDMVKLASSITNEQGKVLKDAVRDVLHVQELVGNVCGMTTFQMEEFVSNGFTKALGIYVGICTSNLPIMISVWMFLLAITYGNTFILVSSINNSGTSIMFAKLVMEAGLPTGVLNIIYGNDDIINNLCHDDCIHTISVVCSNIGMIHKYRRASEKGKRLLWDIWAKHYAIVMPDANIDSTVDALVTAGFGVSGKRCMAISSVVFVGDSAKWESKLVERANKLKVNAEEDADIGPIINKWEVERTCGLIESSIEAGGRLVIDGRDIIVPGYENGNFMGPTILSDVKVHMKCFKNEMFGPVLLCLQAKNLEEAIDIVNHYEYICGASIFTSSDAAAIKFHTEVNAGQVGINVLNPISLPFTSSAGNKMRYPSTIHS